MRLMMRGPRRHCASSTRHRPGPMLRSTALRAKNSSSPGAKPWVLPGRSIAAIAATLAILTAALAAPVHASDPPHAPPELIQACDDCHILHNAPGMTLTSVAGNANLCISCHNGRGFPAWSSDQQAQPGVSGSSHKWSGAPQNSAYGASLPSDPELLARVTDANGQPSSLICSSCHNQHKQTLAPADPRAPAYGGADTGHGRHYQRMANDTNQMCLDCHAVRNLSDAGHGAYTGNDLSHPVGIAIPQASSNFHPTPLEPDGVTAQSSIEWGNASGGSTTTLDDSSKAWTPDSLAGRWLRLTSGNNRNLIRQITANSATQLSFDALPTSVGIDDSYEIDADGNFSNDLTLGPSGQVLCTSCHGVHYADSDSSTYDDTPRTGDGMLLRRANYGSQCRACHDLAIHNSDTLGTKYGTWGSTWDCRQCHRPHSTTNINLVNESITTPNSGNRAVDFRYQNTGLENYGLANAAAPGSGPCEVCHTQTRNSDGSPRYRNSGGGDGGKHCEDTCTDCHTHKTGFLAGESEGGLDCQCCHGDIWFRMNQSISTNPGGQNIASRHSIGALHGTNDSYQQNNPDATWTTPLDSVAPASRSCTNMCHSDHPHDKGAINTHENNLYQDATNSATRGTAGAVMDTDFDETLASGGLCMSCHDKPVTIAGELHPALSKNAYAASKHNYKRYWFEQHDGGRTDRNCGKCHADSGEEVIPETTRPFGAVHFSAYDSLLMKSNHGNGDTAKFLCYNCHGNSCDGCHNMHGPGPDPSLTPVNHGVINLEKVFGTDSGGGPSGGRTYTHPITVDNTHDSIAEAASSWNDGRFSGSNRHVNCVDCHNTHESGSTLHAQGSSLIAAGSTLLGASGLTFTAPATAWTATAAGNFTWTDSASYEYEICFKCHSSYAWGATPPSGLTDQSLEFNPNNRSHNVVGQSGGGAPPTVSADFLYFRDANVSEPAPNSHQTGDSFSGGSWASHNMTISEGANRASYSTNSSQNNTRYYQARTFVSDALSAQTINSGTWEFRITAREDDSRVNARIRIMVYIWRSDDSLGPVIYGPQTRSTELPTSYQVITWSFSGAAAAVNDNDRLVVDVEFSTWDATRQDSMRLRWNDSVGSGDYGRIDPPGSITLFDSGGGGGCYGVFVNGWACDDYMTCSDCHGSDTAGDAAGPHGSDTPGIFSNGILKASWSVSTGIGATSDHLCFNCHDWNTYSDQAVDGNNTGFSEQGGSKNLHRKHMRENVGCPQCHGRIPHGWPYDYPVFTKDDTAIDAVYRSGVGMDKDDIPNWGPSTNWVKNDCMRAHMSCK